jgi:hypothetical protein
MADKSLIQTTAGQHYTAVAAGGTGDAVVSAEPGRACKVVCTAAGTASFEIYDHASASASGTLIYKSPADTEAGSMFDLQVPVAAGIVFKKAAGTPACVVTYTKDSAYGR